MWFETLKTMKWKKTVNTIKLSSWRTKIINKRKMGRSMAMKLLKKRKNSKEKSMKTVPIKLKNSNLRAIINMKYPLPKLMLIGFKANFLSIMTLHKSSTFKRKSSKF